MVASGARDSAATRPASMLAPNALDATCWPSVPIAAVISRVVVVFPLVPVTSTICRPRASSESRSGLSRRPMTPPMTEPSPRPASREARPAAPPTVVARRARRGRPGRRDGGLLVLIGAMLSGRGRAQVVRVRGRAQAGIGGGAQIRVGGGARIRVRGGAQAAGPRAGAQAGIGGGAQIRVGGGAQIRVRGGAQVRVRGGAQVCVRG